MQHRTTKGNVVKMATLKIDGMQCEGCARTIEAVVSKEPGVHQVTVSFSGRNARILFDPEAVTEERLATAIQKTGFAVTSRSS